MPHAFNPIIVIIFSVQHIVSAPSEDLIIAHRSVSLNGRTSHWKNCTAQTPCTLGTLHMYAHCRCTSLTSTHCYHRVPCCSHCSSPIIMLIYHCSLLQNLHASCRRHCLSSSPCLIVAVIPCRHYHPLLSSSCVVLTVTPCYCYHIMSSTSSLIYCVMLCHTITSYRCSDILLSLLVIMC